MQAPLSLPLIRFKCPRDGGLHLWGGGEVQFFTLAVIPSHIAQMPVLNKNLTVQGGEERPLQNGIRVLPVPKGHGGHVCFIARPQLYRFPHGAHLGRDFFNSTAVTAAAAAATAASGGTLAR